MIKSKKIKKTISVEINEFYCVGNSSINEYCYVKVHNLASLKNMSMNAICDDMQIGWSVIDKWKYKNGAIPSLKTICKICDYFNITLSEFFKDFNINCNYKESIETETKAPSKRGRKPKSIKRNKDEQ